MTLATKITLARIFLIIPTVVLYIVGMLEESVKLPLLIVSCVLFAILCSTDFVDGHIARKTNTVSALGKFLDPLADKIVIVVMLFLIVYFPDLELFPYDGLVTLTSSSSPMTGWSSRCSADLSLPASSRSASSAPSLPPKGWCSPRTSTAR